MSRYQPPDHHGPAAVAGLRQRRRERGLPVTDPTPLDAICATCGLTKGAHRADSKIPDQCPEHEGWMDWPDHGITTFRDSGERGEVERGTASKRAGR